MKLDNVFYFLAAFLFFGCGDSDSSFPVDLSKVTLSSPSYMRLQLGETVNFQLEVPEDLKLSYSWTCDNQLFSTEKNPDFKIEKSGLLNVVVRVKGGDETKELRTIIFVPKKADYQSIAYVPSWKSNLGNLTNNWNKLTHICLCFGLVATDGSIDINEVQRNLTSVIEQAHRNGVSVLLSIGGGGGDGENFSTAILNETSRKAIVSNVLTIIESLKLDGVDVDYEQWDYSPTQKNIERSNALEELYKDLKIGLPKNTLLTIATAWSYMRNGGYKESMNQYLDLVNMMIYDYTGAWAGSDVGPHSGWNYYLNSINIAKSFNIPNHKIIAGIPFYGIKFRSANSSSGAIHLAFSEIVNQYPGAEDSNEVTSAFLYYDGKPIVRRKSEYVVQQNLGGIMVWEITQDTPNPSKSLLGVIDDVLGISK